MNIFLHSSTTTRSLATDCCLSRNASVCINMKEKHSPSKRFLIFFALSDAHWGNILYSHERGIQLIDFGIAALVDRFELPDYRAALVITFTFDRCLDCETSKSGRDFHHLAKSQYPIDGHSLLSHPWLQY